MNTTAVQATIRAEIVYAAFFVCDATWQLSAKKNTRDGGNVPVNM